MKTEQDDTQKAVRKSALPGDDIFSRFIAPMSEVPDTLPADLVPCRHAPPEPYDDPSASFPERDVIFGNDLRLTDAKDGLRSQKVNQNISEIANALLHRFEFASVAGQMAVYKPPCWGILSREEAARFIKDNVSELFPKDAKYLNSRQYGEIINQLLHDSKTKFLQEIPAPDYRYLCCRDCMYDWYSGECLPHSSSYMRFSYLDLDAETIGNCDGTHWKIFLDNLTDGNPALYQRILEVLGDILSGYPSKSFFFLVGESNTGKSQIANFLKGILGKSACAALNDVSQLGQQWTPATLFGKLLCICGDMPNAPLDSKTIGAIKQLTGDDLIRGECKYQDPFTFENTAKLLFVSNYPLQIPNQNQEDALMNRLVTIPCHNPVSPSKQIPQLHMRLAQEAGYIIALAMDALKGLIARNGEFTPLPAELDVEMVKLPGKEQVIKDFVEACCIFEKDACISVKDIYSAFQNFVPETLLIDSEFSKRLGRLYPQIERHPNKANRRLLGIRLRSPNIQTEAI